MKVPEGRPTIARRFNGGFRLLKPIESRRDERKHAFVRDISAAPSGRVSRRDEKLSHNRKRCS